jgi:hypothetical protein
MTFVPWLAWLLGLVSLKDFFFMFTNTATVLLFFLLFFYFLINFRMAINGQTWYEKSKNVRFKTDRMKNFVEIFGYNWKFALLCPFVELKLPGDGTSLASSNETNVLFNLKNV